jgi:hypothetical protein
VWNCQEELVNLDDAGLGTWTLRSEANRLQCFRGLAFRLKGLSEAARRRALVLALRVLRASGGPEQDDEPMLTWEMVRELRQGGITMGTHTISHPILTQLDDDEARREIVESKRRIEEELGDSVRHFAYPNGAPLDWNVRLKEIVRATGLETAVTAIPGSNPVGHDLYSLRRIEVNDVGCTDPFGRFSRAMFEAQLVGFFGGWERSPR